MAYMEYDDDDDLGYIRDVEEVKEFDHCGNLIVPPYQGPTMSCCGAPKPFGFDERRPCPNCGAV
jgi:hypothetical protein